MNLDFFEIYNECDKALKEENEQRKKYGLPPSKRNITFIDYTNDVQSKKTKHNRSPEEQAKFKKRQLIISASNAILEVASVFSKVQGKIKYRINKINKSNKIIDFDKSIYTNDLLKLSKKCGLLCKKYAVISDKIEQEQLETCADTCLEKYVEKSDIAELNKIHKSFVEIWNSYANFINKEIKKLKS
tara:strand:- start:81 stop:641 length:561 start_codon:yes stop_codon:yes gene_type:complete